MIIVRFIANFVFWFLFRILFVASALLAIPFSSLPNGGRIPFHNVVRRMLRMIFFLTFTRVKITGTENLPQSQRLLFISNRPRRHFPLFLISHFPFPLRFVVSQNILRFPIVGRVARALGYIPYPKEKDAKKPAFLFSGLLYSALRSQDKVMMFYENLRGRSRRRVEARKRIIEIARLCQAEIVPVFMTTRGVGNGRNRDIFLLGEVEIEIGKPIQGDEISSIFEPF